MDISIYYQLMKSIMNPHCKLYREIPYDDNGYGYFCDPSIPNHTPFSSSKYKIKPSKSYPVCINMTKINEEMRIYEESEKNKLFASTINRYLRGIAYAFVIVGSMFITWLLNEYKYI